MPISSDKARFSIEFLYEYETPTGEVLQYNMKYAHTEHGPIISVHQPPYEEIQLPADMFTEVTQFLTQQGIFNRGVVAVVNKQTLAAGTAVPTANASLPVSSIGKRAPNLGKTPTTAAVPQTASSVLPQDMNNSTEEEKPKVAVSDEEVEKLKKARLEAVAKAKAAKVPGVKSQHKPK